MLGGLTVGRFAVADDVEPIEHDSACSNGKATEIYTIELPKGMKVSSLPKSTNFANSVQRFEASYQLKGQVLHVRRVAEDTTPTAVCTPTTLTSYRTFGGKLMDHLEQQVLYK